MIDRNTPDLNQENALGHYEGKLLIESHISSFGDYISLIIFISVEGIYKTGI